MTGSVNGACTHLYKTLESNEYATTDYNGKRTVSESTSGTEDFKSCLTREVDKHTYMTSRDENRWKVQLEVTLSPFHSHLMREMDKYHEATTASKLIVCAAQE